MRKTSEYCMDMDGMAIHEGDRAVCLALPEKEPCVVKVVAVLGNGLVRVTNGRRDQDVPTESCILQDLAVAN